MKDITFFLILLASFVSNSAQSISSCDATVENLVEDYPTIYITTSYFIERSGKHKSALANSEWCLDGKRLGFYHDCKSLERIHSRVNSIFAQANIKLISDHNCNSTPCPVQTSMPSEGALSHSVVYNSTNVDPNLYVDQLNDIQRLREGMFVLHTSLLNAASSAEWEVEGYHAELFIHFVKSLRVPGNSKDVVGEYVPEGTRKAYTNQKLDVKGSYYPSNTSRYLILIGYDDLDSIDDVAETVAHEIGHALGLGHYDYRKNLMNASGLGNSNLTSDQIESMRTDWPKFKRYGGGVSDYKHACSKTENSTNEIHVDNIEIEVEHNTRINGKIGLKIFPKFNIYNAEGHRMKVSAYFYFENGQKIKDLNNNYKTTDGFVYTGHDIEPLYEEASYNRINKNFYLFIPMEELHLKSGVKHYCKFCLVFWDGDKQVERSGWVHFQVQ